MFELKKIKLFLISLAIPLFTGALSAWLTPHTAQSYSNLNLPPYSPPSIVFPIVWMILYVMIGVSSFLVLNQPYPSSERKLGLIFFYLQLFLNFWWSIVFFGWGYFSLGFWLIVLMLFLTLMTFSQFVVISKNAAYLLIPYILWLCFALLLNLEIDRLN